MKTKLIFKGILLWTTILAATMFILGADSIYKKGYLEYFIPSVAIIALLIFLCSKFISVKEFEILSLSKWLEEGFDSLNKQD